MLLLQLSSGNNPSWNNNSSFRKAMGDYHVVSVLFFQQCFSFNFRQTCAYYGEKKNNSIKVPNKFKICNSRKYNVSWQNYN